MLGTIEFKHNKTNFLNGSGQAWTMERQAYMFCYVLTTAILSITSTVYLEALTIGGRHSS